MKEKKSYGWQTMKENEEKQKIDIEKDRMNDVQRDGMPYI